MLSIDRAISPPGEEGSQTEEVYHESVDKRASIECRGEDVVVPFEKFRSIPQGVELTEERSDETRN